MEKVEQAVRSFDARVDLHFGVLAHGREVGLLLALMLDSGLCCCFRNSACAFLFGRALLRLSNFLLADALHFCTHEFLGAKIVGLALLLHRLAIAAAKQCQGEQRRAGSASASVGRPVGVRLVGCGRSLWRQGGA